METKLDDIYTQTHVPGCSDTTVQAGAEHMLNRERYREFFEGECQEFHNGVEETDLEGSYINCLGNGYYCPEIIGTYWTGLEKENFFWALGRYGISQLDRIQRFVPEKSVLEIMNYYDILRRNLDESLENEGKRSKLASYSEMPEAVEVDEVAIEVEERLASEEATACEEPQEFSDRLLVDGDCLETVGEMLNWFHKKSSKICVDADLQRVLSRIARTLTRKLIRKVIKTKIHNSTISRSEATLSEDGQLSLAITVTDIHRACLEIGTNRPFTRFPMLKRIYTDHFNMKKAKPDEDAVDLYRGYDSMILFKRNEEMAAQVEESTLESSSFDVNSAQEDDMEELLSFISETMRLNEEHDRNKHEQVQKFMTSCGGIDLYFKLLKERSEELPLKRSIDYTTQDFEEVEAELRSGKRIKMENIGIDPMGSEGCESQDDQK